MITLLQNPIMNDSIITLFYFYKDESVAQMEKDYMCNDGMNERMV